MSSTQNKSGTAYETNALLEKGNITLDDIARSLSEGYFRPIIERVIYLIFKYKESERFVGVDRGGDLDIRVKIDAGVGTTSTDAQLANIDNMLNDVRQTIQLYLQIQDVQSAATYMKIQDDLLISKAKLLKQESIAEDIEDIGEQQEAMEMQQMQQIPQGAMQ